MTERELVSKQKKRKRKKKKIFIRSGAVLGNKDNHEPGKHSHCLHTTTNLGNKSTVMKKSLQSSMVCATWKKYKMFCGASSPGRLRRFQELSGIEALKMQRS